MKFCIVIILSIVFLTGCTSADENLDRAMNLRTTVSKADQVQFQCTVTADYYDEVCSFVIDCVYDEYDQILFEVVEPNTISGISGVIDGKEGQFTFDDQILVFKPMDGGCLSPIFAPWFLLDAIEGGFIHSVSEHKEGYCVTYRDSFQDETLMIEVFLTKDDVPIKCEIYLGERRILLLEIRNFVFV